MGSSSRVSTPAARRRRARHAAGARGSASKVAGPKKARTTGSKPARPARPEKPEATKPKSRGAAAKPKARTSVAKRKPPAKPKARKAKPKVARPKGQPKSLRARLPWILGTCVVAAALLAAGYQLWFRSSSLVAVEKVTITGMSGPQRGPAEAALRKAASEMTTLNVDRDALARATAGFATVAGVEADADFPHGLTIEVTERPPVLTARSASGEVPVGGDGTLLTGVDAEGLSLPAIDVKDEPKGGKLTGDALKIALVMGVAPEPLRELVRRAEIGGPEGVQLTLRGDVVLYFGESEHLAQKWAAAAAVLADPKITELTYLDLRVPERPAVGGAAPAVEAETTETTEPETGPTTAVTPGVAEP